MAQPIIHQAILGWGKLRRIYLIHLRRTYVQKQLRKRQGECQRCGACCKLMFPCWALTHNNGSVHCDRYHARSSVCRIFPIDDKDLKDRDLVHPQVKCGFHFNNSSPKTFF